MPRQQQHAKAALCLVARVFLSVGDCTLSNVKSVLLYTVAPPQTLRASSMAGERSRASLGGLGAESRQRWLSSFLRATSSAGAGSRDGRKKPSDTSESLPSLPLPLRLHHSTCRPRAGERWTGGGLACTLALPHQPVSRRTPPASSRARPLGCLTVSPHRGRRVACLLRALLSCGRRSCCCCCCCCCRCCCALDGRCRGPSLPRLAHAPADHAALCSRPTAPPPRV